MFVYPTELETGSVNLLSKCQTGIFYFVQIVQLSAFFFSKWMSFSHREEACTPAVGPLTADYTVGNFNGH